VIELHRFGRDESKEAITSGGRAMLAEKFILLLESMIRGQTYSSETHSDGSPRIVSSSRHVPVKLPNESGK